MKRRPYIRRDHSRALALIVTLWIVLGIAALVLVFSRSVRMETVASANAVAGMQADAVAKGALQYVRANLDGRQGVPPLDTDIACEAVQVGDGYFWVLRPPRDDETGYCFGLVPEPSKLNLNTATLDMLNKLPDMTTDAAASIKAWRDPANVATPEGAESEYYLSLPDPYNCKNSFFETVEELFLVKGVAPALLYGQDLNRNGVLDAGEQSDGTIVTGLATGQPDCGVYNFVTTYSIEPATVTGAPPQVNVNTAGSSALLPVLQMGMTRARANQVIALLRGARPFQNLMDFYFRMNLTAAEFAPIAGRLTTQQGGSTRGLIDVNTAPKSVLLCLPGLESGDADALAAARASSGTDRTSVAWVAAALPRAKAIAIGSYITARAFQYTADIVALSGNGRAFRRYRAVLDTRSSPPKVIYWKDLTYLGWPLSPDIQTNLRNGIAPVPSSTVALTTAGNS